MESADFELPEPAEGWALAKLGDVAQVVGGGTPNTREAGNFCESGGHPWLTPADLGGFGGIYVSRGARNLTGEGLRTSSAKPMPRGAVLMSSRAPIGYVAVAANEISTNQGFKSFVCSEALLPEYVFFWLKFIGPLLESLGSGSTFSEISGGKAKEIPILVAPLAEQRRIVAKVEALLAQINAARERLSKIPPVLKRLRRSVLAATFSRYEEDHGLLRGARLVPGSELFTYVTSGSRNWARFHADTGSLFLRMTNLDHDTISLDLRKRSFVKLPVKAEGTRTRVEPGDLLISITADVGMIGLAERGLGEAYINQHIALARPNGTVVLSQYLAWYLASPRGQAQFKDAQRGATKVGLGLDDIVSIQVPCPTVAEQRSVVAEIEAQMRLVDQVNNRHALALASAEQLPQALFSKGFAGEIVPTEAELARGEGREYEPAAQLLERIRATK